MRLGRGRVAEIAFSFRSPILPYQPKKDDKPDPNAVSTSAVQFAYVDPNLSWEDLDWIRSLAPGKPLVLKGIGSVADVKMAVEYGCQGVVLSNHGVSDDMEAGYVKSPKLTSVSFS